MLAPFIEVPYESPLDTLTLESFRLYDEFIAAVQDASGMSIEYRRCGTFEFVETLDDEDRLTLIADRARAAGYQAERGQLGPDGGSGASGRGLLIPAQGYVRVEQLIAALRQAAETRGARFNEGEGVERIAETGQHHVVHTPQRQFSCDAVIVAAGSWSDSLGLEPVGVRPIRGQLVRLRCAGQPPPHVLWTHDCYVVPWTDGTLLVGATLEDVGFDEAVTEEGVRGLLRAVSRLLPGGAETTFVDARAGLRPLSSDGLPVMRPSERFPRVIYATGHYRNGILLAPLTARRVADLVERIP